MSIVTDRHSVSEKLWDVLLDSWTKKHWRVGPDDEWGDYLEVLGFQEIVLPRHGIVDQSYQSYFANMMVLVLCPLSHLIDGDGQTLKGFRVPNPRNPTPLGSLCFLEISEENAIKLLAMGPP